MYLYVKNSKLFKVNGGMSNKTDTVMVETLKPLGGEPVFALEMLEGEYDSREEFEDALDYTVKEWEKGYARDNDKIRKWELIHLKIPEVQKLVKVLEEALQAYEED